MNEIKLESGNTILESTINELVDIEMSEGCHMDYIEDYDTPLDFYLSNVTTDDYINYLEEAIVVDLYTKEDLEEIKDLVTQKIIESL